MQEQWISSIRHTSEEKNPKNHPKIPYFTSRLLAHHHWRSVNIQSRQKQQQERSTIMSLFWFLKEKHWLVVIKTNITNVDFDNDVDTINDSCDDELWGVALVRVEGWGKQNRPRTPTHPHAAASTRDCHPDNCYGLCLTRTLGGPGRGVSWDIEVSR